MTSYPKDNQAVQIGSFLELLVFVNPFQIGDTSVACEVESLAVACTSFTDHTASFMPVTGRHEPTERPSSSSPITKHEHHELVNNLKWEREEAYHLTSTVLLRHTPRTSGRSNVFSAMQYDIGQFHTRTRPKYCTGQEAHWERLWGLYISTDWFLRIYSWANARIR